MEHNIEQVYLNVKQNSNKCTYFSLFVEGTVQS